MNFQPPEDPAHDEFVREMQAEAHWDKQLTAAYAEGRKDERKEWLPVLEALQGLLDPATNEDGGWYREAREKALAAIAKAEQP